MNLLKLIFAPHKLIEAFTFYADGGIGEAALIGAAVGGGTALVTGNDPLRGALLGGVTGGLGGAAFGGAGAAAGAAGGATTAAANPAFMGAVQDTLGTNLAAQAAAAPIAQTTAGIAGNIPTDVFGLANYTGAAAPSFSAANVGTQAVNDVLAPATQVFNPDLLKSSLGTNFADLPVNAPQAGMLDRLGNWYGGLSTGEKIGLGIAGGVAMNSLGQPTQVEVPPEEENPYGLATFNRSKFKPYTPTPNVYKPAGYAAGGIAAAVPSNMFPQGMQQNAQYAVPSQMPTSSEVVNADYDPLTNPYTGQMTGMAEGGQTELKPSGAPSQNVATRTAIDNYLAGRMTRDVAPPAQPIPVEPAAPPAPATPTQAELAQLALAQQYGMNGKGGVRAYNGMGGPVYPNGMYPNGMYGKGAGAMYSQPAAARDTYVSKNFQPYNPQAAVVNPNVYRPGYAAGGSIESSLGGYASGGNPRLLKGPGDGMSDHIPAVIGGKQPARLAEGEFVVPADVVSHLGNGSTDAGAKQLYSMMDKVRKARTGSKQQGKQIKAGKFLPA